MGYFTKDQIKGVKDEAKKSLAVTMMNFCNSPFPSDKIPEGFYEHLRMALMFNSQGALKCTHDTWKTFCLGGRDLTFGEVDLSLIVLRNATPDEIGQSLAENVQMLDVIHLPLFSILKSIETEFEIESKKTIKAFIFEKIKGLPFDIDLFSND